MTKEALPYRYVKRMRRLHYQILKGLREYKGGKCSRCHRKYRLRFYRVELDDIHQLEHMVWKGISGKEDLTLKEMVEEADRSELLCPKCYIRREFQAFVEKTPKDTLENGDKL